MDDRLFAFANIYELEVVAQARGPRAVPRAARPGAARPGMGARLMQTLRSTQTRLRQMPGQAVTGIRNTIRNLGRVPEKVQALTRGGNRARIRFDSRSGKIIGADTPAEIQALKQQGFTDAEIRMARNQAMRNHYVTLRHRSAAQGRAARQRVLDRAKAMFTKGLSGSHIQGRIAGMSPTARTGMIVMTGATVMYYLFTGNSPSAATEDGQAVIADIPPPSNPMIPEMTPQIDAVLALPSVARNTQVAGALNATKTALAGIQGSQVTIDDPASTQAFVQKVRGAESAVNAALQQLETAITSATPQELETIKLLMGTYGEFIIEILNVRGMQA